MKRGFVKFLTVTAAMVSMLSIGMTASAAESYTVVAGDHLMKIAQNKYGDETKWNVIFEANKETIKEPTKIYPGQVIVIPDLTEGVAAPETTPAPAAAVAAPETAPAPAAAVATPETAPAPAAVVEPETVQTPAAMTLEDYYKDPEFKKELDAQMSMISDVEGMEVSIAFQGNTMAVVIKIMEPSYIIDGLGDALNEGMEQVGPLVEDLVALLESELGNPGNCAVIYSFQSADGQIIAQKVFTAK